MKWMGAEPMVHGWFGAFGIMLEHDIGKDAVCVYCVDYNAIIPSTLQYCPTIPKKKQKMNDRNI